jgi:hypothetical protein
MMVRMPETVPPAVIALRLLAEEWGEPIEALIADLSPGQVLVDAGVRYVARSTAIELLARRNEAAAARAEADARRFAEADAMMEPTRRRVAAIAARQRQLRAEGTIDANTSAVAAMRIDDADERLTASAERLDELFQSARRGDYGVLHRYQQEE